MYFRLPFPEARNSWASDSPTPPPSNIIAVKVTPEKFVQVLRLAT